MSLVSYLRDSIFTVFGKAVGVRSLSLQETQFINGNAFTVSDYEIDLNSLEVVEFLFDPTACIDKQIVSEVPKVNASAGPVTVEFITDPSVTDNGTELPSFNRRATSTNTAQSKLYQAPTYTGGTRFSALLVPATAAGSGDTGGVTFEGLPFEIDCTKKIIIKITNLNGAGSDVGYRFDWSEADI
jgi:hypothetical protein